MRIPLSYNLRNLFVRRTTAALTAAGIALTVAVLVAVLAMNEGMRDSLEATGHPLHLIVLRKGATSELTSVMLREVYQSIRAMPGVETASLEIVTGITMPGEAGSKEASNLTLRGLAPEGLALRPGLRIVEGRAFAPGKREVVVGRSLAARFPGARLGRELRFGRGLWRVVGVADGGGSSWNSEVFADLHQVAADYNRPQALSSILIRVNDEAALPALRHTLEQDRRLNAQAQPEQEYYRAQMVSALPIQFMGTVVSILLAVGSCFSAMNTMYAAVARRTAEIGTLRVLGFSRGSILLSFLVESIVLALLGGALGCLLAWPLHNLDTAIGNFVTFTEFSFRLKVTWPIAALGMGLGLLMGVAGGLFPAWSASRRDILAALRTV
jgi:putative ABC transport system permease protein